MRVVAKILIVEDEPLIRFVLADQLLEEGYSVIECGNVLEAIAALGVNDDVDAIVTDVEMPGALNGLDLARLIKATKPFIHVLVTSGREIDLTDLDWDASFFPKPYDLKAIANEIGRRVGSHASRFLPKRPNAAR
ncbi:response regulator [Rhizobium sp. RHZ01]|jgi:CheY-like chemotaxis protein|uniref:response regulator n=1 Tax=Rhizobium sp. RHZ01 TaxID=2769304 RepID=UPI00177B759D|nr:response regulator [Rhizobium sp. RHZ01]MBD9447063.1 response regulator [Rhizobium sp. RHZ01]